MTTSDPITRLLVAARDYLPFGESREYGFETRLRVALAKQTPTLPEVVARFSWRFSFVAVPLVLVIGVIITQQTQGHLPEGIDGFVAQWSHWAEFLPGGF
ncbi:MAG: hypothetical protein CMO61_05080 [Verrucomicrobiales bacterium]|jgi:hypothetical protein|nr:hypothetical protein [Verrucomicrobiales bacterium]|tara:strand:- start:15287 stop:15586 length:300 start_codon:yes stop_codon:yes gene_type:complete